MTLIYDTAVTSSSSVTSATSQANNMTKLINNCPLAGVTETTNWHLQLSIWLNAGLDGSHNGAFTVSILRKYGSS